MPLPLSSMLRGIVEGCSKFFEDNKVCSEVAMPIYDFRCENDQCLAYNHIKELLTSSELSHQVMCDECIEPMTRLLSAPYGRVVGGASNIPVKRRSKTNK